MIEFLLSDTTDYVLRCFGLAGLVGCAFFVWIVLDSRREWRDTEKRNDVDKPL